MSFPYQWCPGCLPNDSLWNFPSKRHHKAESNCSQFYTELLSLSLRCACLWGNCYPLYVVYSILWPFVQRPLSICSTWLNICDGFWAISHLSQVYTLAPNIPRFTPAYCFLSMVLFGETNITRRVLVLLDLPSGLPSLATKPHLTQGLSVLPFGPNRGQSRGTTL